MGKTRRAGRHYQIEKVYEDLVNGKIYHRPLIESKYWLSDASESPAVVPKSGPRVIFNEVAPAGLYEHLLKTSREKTAEPVFKLIPCDPGSSPLSWAWVRYEGNPREWLKERMTKATIYYARKKSASKNTKENIKTSENVHSSQ